MYESLKKEYQNCTKCPLLCQTRQQVVWGSGNPQAEILLIGEAPGANEDKKGIPFCGMSGKILDQLLQEAKIKRDEIFITNTILCRPPSNRNPNKLEVANCKSRLDKLIILMQPKVIVTIGNFATNSIINKTNIMSIRGQKFDYNGISVIPVVHPASYLYSGRKVKILEQMKNDFLLIKSCATSVDLNIDQTIESK